jgi:predicted nucleotidyltransferase
MKYGLPDSALSEIKQTFRQCPKVEKAVLFGSRAKGNFRNGSDIDIAVYGKDLSFDDFLTLKVKLDELDLLESIDLIKFESIEDPDLIDHIKRVGIVLFDKRDNVMNLTS